MTDAFSPHLAPTDVDAWLDGKLSAASLGHLEQCGLCAGLLRSEREIVNAVATLPQFAPTAGFSDRVMAAVHIPEPLGLRLATAPMAAWRRRPALWAAAASVAVAMGGSVWWSLEHQLVLTQAASWLTGEGVGVVRGVAQQFATSVVDRPFFDPLRQALASRTRLAAAGTGLAFAYVGGLFTLRRLLALPAQGAAHAAR